MSVTHQISEIDKSTTKAKINRRNLVSNSEAVFNYEYPESLYPTSYFREACDIQKKKTYPVNIVVITVIANRVEDFFFFSFRFFFFNFSFFFVRYLHFLSFLFLKKCFFLICFTFFHIFSFFSYYFFSCFEIFFVLFLFRFFLTFFFFSFLSTPVGSLPRVPAGSP